MPTLHKRSFTRCLALIALGSVSLGGPLEAQATDAQYFDGSALKGPAIVQVPPLRYVVLKSGPPEGRQPTRSSAVKVRYTGSLTDGTIFDQSLGKTEDGVVIFPVRSVIPGFSASLQKMRPGDEWVVYIPAELAYPNSGPVAGKDLIFRIELLDSAELPSGPSPLMKELPK